MQNGAMEVGGGVGNAEVLGMLKSRECWSSENVGV